MSLVVGTNIGSLNAQRSLASSGIELKSAMERLSTGKRINSAADDAAGFAIAERMTAQIRGLNMAAKNANDGLSMLSVADAAADDITDMLQRMRELAVQADNGTNSLADRQYLQNELEALTHEIDRVATQTQYNGQNLLDGSKAGMIQTGSQANHVINFDFKSLQISSFEGVIGRFQTEGTDLDSPVLAGFSAEQNIADVSNGVVEINFTLDFQDASGGKEVYVTLRHKETGQTLIGSATGLNGSHKALIQLNVDQNTHAGEFELVNISLGDMANNTVDLIPENLGIDYSLHVAGGAAVWRQLGADFNDYFGVLSLDGSLIVGKDRIYSWNGSNWAQQGADIDLGEGKIALSSDGSVIAVGSGSNNRVRIFGWDGSNLVQQGEDIVGWYRSGQSVSLSSDGTVVAIGDNYASLGKGHVRVFGWNGFNWVQQGADIEGEGVIDDSGVSVSLSGDGTLVAIGAIGNDGNGTDAGHVRIYSWNGSNWVQQGADIDGESMNNWFGGSVSLSSDGTSVAIGAIYNHDNGTNAGHVRIHSWNGSNWLQQGEDIDGEPGDKSGHSVSLSSDGTVVAIEALQGGTNGANHARIYGWNGSNWIQHFVEADIVGVSMPLPRLSLSGDGSVAVLGSRIFETESQTLPSNEGYSWSQSVGSGYDLNAINLADSANVIDAIATITAAVERVSDQRAEYGALQNRLNYTISNLMGTVEATEASRSRIEDADFAVEAANLAKAQVLQQAGTVMLAQANAQPQLVLSLIKS